jgi:hypothetical protein
VHRYPNHPLRVQVLRHMHLKWTLAMNAAARSRSGYASDETEEGASDEDELELMLTPRKE